MGSDYSPFRCDGNPSTRRAIFFGLWVHSPMPFQRKLLTSIGFAFLVFGILFVWYKWDEVILAMGSFDWRLLPLCLVLAYSNYLVRFLKWHYYVRILKIPLAPRLSFRIFLSGLMMSATPGKFGEVFKSYLVKETVGTRISRSAPIVFAERLTDLVALVIMALCGIWLVDAYRWMLWIALGLVCAGLSVISYKPLALWVLGHCTKLPVLGRHHEKLLTAYESLADLVAPKPLLLATTISVASWFCECVAFYFVLLGLGQSVAILSATFVYALATIVGALSMLPGGIGGVEVSMVELLSLVGDVPEAVAVAVTLIIRICTLWFAVGVGITVLLINRDTFAPVAERLENEQVNAQVDVQE